MLKFNITDKKYNYPAFAKPSIDYTFSFEFKGREEYLEFRREWKERYMQLSKEIREAKGNLKNEMRRQAAEPDHQWYSVWKLEGSKFTLQEEARMMMQLVEAAKKEANRLQCITRELKEAS